MDRWMPTITIDKDRLCAQLWQIGFQGPASDKAVPRHLPVQQILWQLIQAKDAGLLSGFVALIAYCATHQISIDLETLIGEHPSKPEERRSMSQMLLASLLILKALNHDLPSDLKGLQAPLQMAHGDLLSQPTIQLANGLILNTKDLQQAIAAYLNPATVQPLACSDPNRPTPLDQHLKRLFAPKQIDLIHKKLNNQPMTKTEREYFSRVVRKRLEALADREMYDMARLLIFGAR